MIEFPESSRVFSRAVDKDVISIHLQREIPHSCKIWLGSNKL